MTATTPRTYAIIPNPAHAHTFHVLDGTGAVLIEGETLTVCERYVAACTDTPDGPADEVSEMQEGAACDRSRTLVAPVVLTDEEAAMLRALASTTPTHAAQLDTAQTITDARSAAWTTAHESEAAAIAQNATCWQHITDYLRQNLPAPTATSRPAATRRDTLARWAAALDRAQTKGIHLYQHPVSGDFFATSSNGADLYRVGWYDCECAAGQGGDPVCLHRALFREHCREDDQQVSRTLAGKLADTGTKQAVADMYRERTICPACGAPAWSELYYGGSNGTMLRFECTACQEAAQRVPAPAPAATVADTLDMDDEPIGLTDDELSALIDAEPLFTITPDVPRSDALATLDGWVAAHRPGGIAPEPECRDCLGTGYQRMSTGGRLNQWLPVTCGCQRQAAA